MSYERGFEEGERHAFEQRSFPEKLRRPRPKLAEEGYVRGYLDGYTPRSQDWVKGVKAFQEVPA